MTAEKFDADLIEVANLFTMLPPPSSEGVLIVSTSGGMCSLLSDMCGLHHIDLPSIAQKQSIFIKEQTYLLTMANRPTRWISGVKALSICLKLFDRF